MSVWNPRVNTGFPFLISLSRTFIPPADIRVLRELSRYRLKLSYMRTAEKNPYQNSMTISRIRIDCVLTGPFSLSATRIMDYLLFGEPFDEEKCRSLIDHRVKASKAEVMDAVHGYHILEEQKFNMIHAKSHMDFINKSIDGIEAALFLRSRRHDISIKRITTVTGITELSALFILSEIGADMSVFKSDRHLCSRSGLIPANNESASKKKTIIAFAQMMLTNIYHMLSNNEDFHPDDYEATVNPPKQNPVILTLDSTLHFLRAQGADPETFKPIQQQCAAQAE